MNQLFSAEGRRALAMAWVFLALALLAGAGIVAGARWYAIKEKLDSANSSRRQPSGPAGMPNLNRSGKAAKGRHKIPCRSSSTKISGARSWRAR